MIVHRHILGVVAATVAAPYVALLPGIMLSTINGSGGFAGFLPGNQMEAAALIFFGTLALILAGIGAAILHRLKLQTRGWCMLGGAGVGLVFIGIIKSLPGILINTSLWSLLGLSLHFLLPGAICGWIYWRIALGPRAREAARAP